MSQFLMPENRLIYRMLDNPRKDTNGKNIDKTPPVVFDGGACSWDDCDQWNSAKREPGRFYGIFWAVNEFIGSREKKNLTRIVSWAVDIDTGSKESQREKIKKFLTPSLVVETKRGYQVYWHALDATTDNHEHIQKSLVHFFGADANARDISRILRVPYFWHRKDPNDPFLVTVAFESSSIYSEKKMLQFLPKEEKPKERTKLDVRRELMHVIQDGDLFDRIYDMDCEKALMRLSGTAAVCGESFSFERVNHGKMNVYVDGKGTSVFLDANKRIGSSDGGGPTIWQWINWYHNDHKVTHKLMKEHFPELFVGLK